MAAGLLKDATPWPVLPLPTQEEIAVVLDEPGGVELVETVLLEREAKVKAAMENPLEHGYRPAIWDLCDNLLTAGKTVVMDLHSLYRSRPWADPNITGSEFEAVFNARVPKEFRTIGALEINLTGGNSSGKTYYSDMYAVRDMVRHGGHKWWFGSETSSTSIEVHQKVVNAMTPSQWRNKKWKHGCGNTLFSDKTGFSYGKFVYPNRSGAEFKNYEQKETTLEGPQIHGAVLDELVPKQWIETIRLRLTQHNGVLIVSFTPVQGYTPAVGEFRDGATTIAERPAVLLPKETVPVVQRCKHQAHIVYFSQFLDNPFANHRNIRDKMQGRSKQWVLQRTEGTADKRHGALMNTFRRHVHVVRPDQIPAEGTHFMVLDPGGRKPWVAGYYLVTPGDHRTRCIYKYREWPMQNLYVPGHGYFEAWAVPGNAADGDPGPAQQPISWGVKRYVEEFERLEAAKDIQGITRLAFEKDPDKPVVIFMRYGDARALASPHGSDDDESIDLTDELLEYEWDVAPITGRGAGEIRGLELLQSWFDWDMEAPAGGSNLPRFFINEECQNTIDAYEMWTGADGQRGACKDFIDVDRYFVQTDPYHLEFGALASHPGKVW